MGRSININIGDKYGRLTILKELDIATSNTGMRYRIMRCKCDCGNIKEVRLGDLRKKGSRATKSCGCWVKENNSKLNTTHGMSQGNRFYKIWNGINSRCNCVNDYNYKNYGGRGIKCEWEKFEGFYGDMKEGYTDILTIDRIDNNGNYCKSNCRWATRKEQANNRRNNRIYKGKTISQWCEIQNIKRSIVDGRLHRGWSVARALNIEDIPF